MQSAGQMDRLMRRAAESDATLLLTGEPGVGKTTLARQIHEASGRSGALVVVNCALLGETARSELFGHERGSFTGATARHIGAVERAAEGTLLLDEAGDLAPDLQAHLLLLLSERRFDRMGGKESIEATCRVLLATHSPGRLRPDLASRVALTRRVRPLRERREEVPQIIEAIMGRLGGGVDADAVAWCASQPWREGNVRALETALQRALWRSEDGRRVRLQDIACEATEGAREALSDEALVRALPLRQPGRLRTMLLVDRWTIREWARQMRCSMEVARRDARALQARGWVSRARGACSWVRQPVHGDRP